MLQHEREKVKQVFVAILIDWGRQQIILDRFCGRVHRKKIIQVHRLYPVLLQLPFVCP